jgi:hypothetical protein
MDEMDARFIARLGKERDEKVAAAHKARDPLTRARIMHAHFMRVENLPTPTAGSQPHTYPGVKALVIAHTLMAVAGDDAEMRLWASDIEWDARSRIRWHLGWEDDGMAN